MTEDLETRSLAPQTLGLHHHDMAPPIPVPPGHVGPVVLPGTGRLIWWTGRVAIGLRHQKPARHDLITQSAEWVQDLMLDPRAALKAA